MAPLMVPSIYCHLIGCKWSKCESNNFFIVINQFHQPDRPITPTLNHSQVSVRKFRCLVRLCYALRLSEVQFIYISGISVRFFWRVKKMFLRHQVRRVPMAVAFKFIWLEPCRPFLSVHHNWWPMKQGVLRGWEHINWWSAMREIKFK